MDMLTQEGVSEADTVICTTKDERLNLMMALLAKHLGAGQTMVRVTRTEYIALMQQVGIDIVLSTAFSRPVRCLPLCGAEAWFLCPCWKGPGQRLWKSSFPKVPRPPESPS